jgi:putative MATE family efflux protein
MGIEREEASLKGRTATVRDWTKGSIFKNLLSLAWPVIISSSLNNIGPTIDLMWVGKLGSASVAGVGVAGMLVQLLDSLKMGLDMGTRAMIARHVGAGDSRGANHVALQGYVVTIGFAAIVGTTGALLAVPILRMMGLSPDVVAQGAPYLRIEFIGILTMGLVRQNEGTMQSSGDTMNPMRVSIIYRLFHIALCPFLVFGWWIFPRLGTSGAAYTDITSACLGAGIGLWFLLSGHTRLHLQFRDFRPDFGVVWRIVRIGFPASITGMQRTFGQVVLAWFVVPFGTVAVAAHSLTQKIDQFVSIAATSMGQASGVLAGQNLGAKQPGRAEKSGWLGASFCTAIMVAASGALWLWGTSVIRLFNSEPAMLDVGYAFLKIQILSYLFLGYAMALQNCLNVIGDTLPAMLIVLLSTFAVQIPLAYVLPHFTSMGVYGTRWAIVIGTAVMGAGCAIYFRFGAWKRKRV